MVDVQSSLEITQRDLKNATQEVKLARNLSETLKEENNSLNNEVAQMKVELTSRVNETNLLEHQVVSNEMALVQEIFEKQSIIGDLKS